MNWMNGLCMLIGLGIGMEIMWCVMKYRNKGAKDPRDKYLRPCEVDGDKAYAHRWVLDENAATFALIEYIDGTVELVHPERVRFTDN